MPWSQEQWWRAWTPALALLAVRRLRYLAMVRTDAFGEFRMEIVSGEALGLQSAVTHDGLAPGTSDFRCDRRFALYWSDQVTVKAAVVFFGPANISTEG